MFRVGIGQDSHKLVNDSGKKLMLGGVEVESEMAFESDSDGDVMIHSLCNALEQAIGGDSFSTYADKLFENNITDSREYLKVAMQHVKEKGYAVNNIGISVEGKFPKILPIADEIREILYPILGIVKDAIGINATTGEEMTPFGKGEGVQAFAIVSLKKDEENNL